MFTVADVPRLPVSALVLAGLLLGACTDAAERQMANSPESVVTGMSDGPVSLTHDSGLVVTTDVHDGVLEPPVLWDGRWTLSQGNRRVVLTVGSPTPEAPDADDVVSCWGGVGPETPITAQTIRCTQSLMIALAADGGYRRAADVLSEALDAAGGRDRANWGWYCHIGGDIAAAAGVLYGEDPRELMLGEPSFCDFSVLHGVAAAAVTMDPERAAETLAAICEPSPQSPIEPLAFNSQCWHGGGIGLSRVHRFDPLGGLDVCQQAAEQAARDNCSEGLFALWRTYSARLDSGEWSDVDVTVEGCNALDPVALDVDGFAVACYRNAAIMEFIGINGRGNGARSRNLAALLEPTVERFAQGCDRAPHGSAERACWIGYANLLTDLLDFHLDDRGFVVARMGLCERAGRWRQDCYQRLAIGVVYTDQRRRGMDLADVLYTIPVDLRDQVTEETVSWLESIEGRST